MRGEIESRIDAYYYKPSFNVIKERIARNPLIEFKPLGTISEKIFSGSTPLSKGEAYTDRESGIAFIRSGDFTDENEILSDELIYITKETHNKTLRSSKLQKGDLLIAIVGATIGKVGVYNEEFDANINQAICAVRISPPINAFYVQIFLLTNFGQIQLNRIKRPVARANVNLDEIASLLIPIIACEKQDIVIKCFEENKAKRGNLIGKATDIIHRLDQVIAETIGFTFPVIEPKPTFAIKVSNIDKRIDPHFYLPGFKALMDNIRQINNKKLNDIIEFSNEVWNQKDSFENEFPYIEIREIDLTSGKIQNISFVPIKEAPSRAKMVVREHDVIVSTTRPHRGAIAYISKEQDGFIASTGFAVLRKLKTDEISKEYLFYILRTQICLQQMLQRSSGGSYPAITTEELKKIFIPLPPVDIQNQVIKEIKAFVDKAEALKAEAQIELEKTKKEIEALILS